MTSVARQTEVCLEKLNITQISYGATLNIGNYESVKFELTVRVDPGQDAKAVFWTLKHKCDELKVLLKEKYCSDRALPNQS